MIEIRWRKIGRVKTVEDNNAIVIGQDQRGFTEWAVLQYRNVYQYEDNSGEYYDDWQDVEIQT